MDNGRGNSDNTRGNTQGRNESIGNSDSTGTAGNTDTGGNTSDTGDDITAGSDHDSDRIPDSEPIRDEGTVTDDSSISPATGKRTRRRRNQGGESPASSTGRRNSSRQNEVESSEEVVPGEGNLDEVPDFIKNLGFGEEEKPTGRGGARASTIYGQAWKTFFKVPSLAGFGEHWELSREEIREIGEATDLLLKSLPARERTKFVKQLAKYIPIISFSSTLLMITYPRVNRTMEVLRVQAVKNGTQGPGDRSNEISEPSGSEAYRLPTWADFNRNE